MGSEERLGSNYQYTPRNASEKERRASSECQLIAAEEYREITIW